MKGFWEKWRVMISVIGTFLFVFGLATTFVVKSQSIATCEQVEEAKSSAVGVHNKDFAELSEVLREQIQKSDRQELDRQRKGFQQEVYAIEDRMKVEGRTPYLVDRWRWNKQQSDDTNLKWKELYE